MRVLLTEGSGLTARQSATLLHQAGHTVEVLSSDPLCLCRWTRHVHRLHRVPCFGADPFGWLDVALDVHARRDIDVLLPTQEQVAVLSCAIDRLERRGVVTAVPPFAALAQVMDKATAFATLARLALPQPTARLLRTPEELAGWSDFPVYLKLPIGTATSGVLRLVGAEQLPALGPAWRDATRGGGVLAQAPVEGRLLMAQSVFDRGTLAAFHVTVRVREGSRGGASHKRSVSLPAVRALMAALGAGLGWHGALSADLVDGPDGPVFIDVNPRLVEPVNAHRCGVDLIGCLLDVADRRPAAPQPAGAAGVGSHQLLLAVLGAAERTGRRRDVLRELLAASVHRGSYRDSREELTPLHHDPRAAVPVALTALSTLVRPASWRRFAADSVSGYALTAAGWSRIAAAAGLR